MIENDPTRLKPFYSSVLTNEKEKKLNVYFITLHHKLLSKNKFGEIAHLL